MHDACVARGVFWVYLQYDISEIAVSAIMYLKWHGTMRLRYPAFAVIRYLAVCLATSAHAQAGDSPVLIHERWLHAAGVAAHETITHEICGWGMIDLWASFLSAAIDLGIDLDRRYKETVLERRRTEAILTAHGANAPMQRTTGLYATGGCAPSVRDRIVQWYTTPIIMIRRSWELP